MKERGREVQPQKIKTFQKERIEELAKPEEGPKGMIIAGYIFAILGGLFGIFIGWHLATHKKALPNGEVVYGIRSKTGNKEMRS